MITKLDDGTVVYSTNQLVTNTRLLQFASAYATVNDDGEVKLSEPSSKLDVLDEILQELGWKWATSSTPARQGLHAVVFAESRQLLELAEARMIKHGVRHWLLAGGQSDDIRDVIVQEFNTTPGVLLVVIKAGGEGLDFVAARHVIFLQRSWSMLANKQTEDRCHRIGSEQHNKIEIIDLVAPDTKEVEQIPRLHEKFRRLQEIVRDKVVLQQAGDIAQLQALEAEEAEIMRSELL
jgi:SNF2 family DNA or RNA helicase